MSVAAARAGDEAAFEQLVAGHRRELLVHCYRMLGSVNEAEDALQETFVAAWRGLSAFEGRSSIRAWLYRIATNCCLRLTSRRPPRTLSWDHWPARDPSSDLGSPVTDIAFLEPLPDAVVWGNALRAPSMRGTGRWLSGSSTPGSGPTSTTSWPS